MNLSIRNAIRSVKDFFVENNPDFGFDEPVHATLAEDPLFDAALLMPKATRNQQSNQEVVLNALERATENYFLANVSPLLRNVPNLRWQIKQIQVRESANNMHLFAELGKLSPSILNAVIKAVLCKLPCSHAMDMSQYYGFSIAPDKELAGRAVVMWAQLGQETIPMHFHFDDDIFEALDESAYVPGAKARAGGIPAEAAAFRLRLVGERDARDISLEKFPLVIGNALSADVRVAGHFVSAQHLVLNWDAVLQCVFLVDRSKHGTFIKGGRRLMDGERVNLLGDGQFTLTNQANAPRFEYWHGTAPGQGTALLPEIQEPQPNFTPYRPADLVKSKKTLGSMPQKAPFAKQLRAVKTQSTPSPETRICPSTNSGPTLLCDIRSSVHSQPLAWLQVRNAEKRLETVPITGLPFSIGREFDGEGFPVDESYVKVSRTHLRVVEQCGAGFGVSNESPLRLGKSNLTWGETGTESHQFIWTPQPCKSDTGWRVLGSKCLDGESIEVRLLEAESRNENQE